MADYQPVSEADLEPQAPPQGAPDSSPAASTYESVGEGDLAPSGGPAGPTGEFAYRGIPSAAAARFGASNAMANIFGAGATRAARGYANSFAALTAKDQQKMIDSGYKPGDFKSVGGALRWGADVFTAGLSTIEDGFLAIPSAITEGVAGVAEQTAREAGSPTPESVGREFGGAAEAGLSDVGAMHTASMIDAAKAQAAVPGVYANAYRVDPTPGGGLVHTPLGRLPADGAEAAAQSQVAAGALHLGPETADLIHQTYLQTGRPPAEVLMDAKTNAGGVLDDLVAGKVPEVYEPTAGLPPKPEAAAVKTIEVGGHELPLNPDGTVTLYHATDADKAAQIIASNKLKSGGEPSVYLSTAKEGTGYGEHSVAVDVDPAKLEIDDEFGGGRVDYRIDEPETAVKNARPANETAPPPSAPTPEAGISKIGQSIEAKAVEDGLTKGFGQTAGYDKLTIEDQANRATSLINDNLDQARAVIRGEQPLPDGLRGTALITGMEEYIKKNPNADLVYELANSPLVSATSAAAQELRLAAERTPDSATAALQQVKDAMVKQAGGPVEIAKRRVTVKELIPEAGKVLLPKEELSWDRFLESIKC